LADKFHGPFRQGQPSTMSEDLVFIRSNDYLWCIGDPAKRYVPAKTTMQPSVKPQEAKP
jgi:hypothetical protein